MLILANRRPVLFLGTIFAKCQLKFYELHFYPNEFLLQSSDDSQSTAFRKYSSHNIHILIILYTKTIIVYKLKITIKTKQVTIYTWKPNLTLRITNYSKSFLHYFDHSRCFF